MSDDELLLQDWLMTKDRIKHFDDIVVRIRIQGIPIATAILAAGLISYQYTKEVIFFGISAPALVVLAGTLYIIPILALDLFHFKLLMIAVEHGKYIENLPQFKGKLQITTKLTGRWLTIFHIVFAIAIYVVILVAGLSLLISFIYF
ncbi:MAG: hypothetical protein H3Z52_12435 [archaeon]|nr:hypothetical protein [archaeon]